MQRTSMNDRRRTFLAPFSTVTSPGSPPPAPSSSTFLPLYSSGCASRYVANALAAFHLEHVNSLGKTRSGERESVQMVPPKRMRAHQPNLQLAPVRISLSGSACACPVARIRRRRMGADVRRDGGWRRRGSGFLLRNVAAGRCICVHRIRRRT